MGEVKEKSKSLYKSIEEVDESQKLRLIPQIYGWSIVLIGFGIFLILIPTAIGSLYYEGLSVETLFGSVLLVVEGVGIGGGFVAFGTALRKIVIVQATLCVILLLITIWFVVFFSMYGEWKLFLYTLIIGICLISPLAVCVFLDRKEI